MKKIIITLFCLCLTVVAEAATFDAVLYLSKGDKISPYQEKEILYKIFSTIGSVKTMCKVQICEKDIVVMAYTSKITIYRGHVKSGKVYLIVDTVDKKGLDIDGNVTKSEKTDVYQLYAKGWEKLEFNKTTIWPAQESAMKKK